MLGASKPKLTRKTPGERLAELVKRAGLNQASMSKLLDFNSRSGFNRLVNGSRGDSPIPNFTVEQLHTILVGRGSPPITPKEVDDLMYTVPREEVARAPVNRDHVSAPGGLPIRYRVEPGVMYRRGVDRDFGPAPVSATPDFDPGSQWAAIALGTGSTGEVLHCADIGQFPPRSLLGRRVIYSIGADATIVEPVVAKVSKVEDELTVTTLDGSKLPKGTVLGVVIGAYRRE